MSRGRRDRATDRSNLLRRALRAREASRVDYPDACMQKNCGGFGNENHISVHLLAFKAMSKETGYKTRYLRGGERGIEGFFFFCASACLFEKGRGLWQPLNSHRKATLQSYFLTQQTSNLAQEHCLAPHTLQHCTPTRDKAQTL